MDQPLMYMTDTPIAAYQVSCGTADLSSNITEWCPINAAGFADT